VDCPIFTEICNSAINWSDYGNSFSGIQTGLLMTDYLHPGKTTIMSVLCRSPQAETLTKVVTWECDFFVTTRQPQHASQGLLRKLCATEFVQLNHPAYSPDLAPSDYFMIRNLKYCLRGTWFINDEWFERQDIEFYFQGIKGLEEKLEITH